MNLVNLTSQVRERMASEVSRDMAANTLYISDRLSASGRRDYPQLLTEAVVAHDVNWLATQLRIGGRLSESENYTRDGVTRSRKVPVTAADTLAEGEFNRFYCRGVCLLATESDPAADVEVYRAKAVSNPRPVSEAKLGARVKAAGLLTDLRWNQGVDTSLGIPAGPNSGLSVRLVTN